MLGPEDWGLLLLVANKKKTKCNTYTSTTSNDGYNYEFPSFSKEIFWNVDPFSEIANLGDPPKLSCGRLWPEPITNALITPG